MVRQGNCHLGGLGEAERNAPSGLFSFFHFPACVRPSYLGHAAGLEEIREKGQAVAYSEGRDEGNNVVLCAAQADSNLTGLGRLW